MSPAVRVSVVLVNFNAGQDLIECLQSLRAQTRPVHQIIAVDNASTDGSLAEAMKEFPRVIPIANSTNLGFAAAANQGAREAEGDVLLFLNPDVSLSPDCIDKVCECLDLSPGVVGMALSLDADVEDLFGCTIDRMGYPISLKAPGMPLYVPGAVLATSRSLFNELGGFDERYFMFVEDVDYCWRTLVSGFEVSVCSQAVARHRGGGSAPGGYIRSGRVETTAFRFALRERNSLATLLKCAPAWWPIWIIPAYLAKAAILAFGALVIGRPDLSGHLIGGVWWNGRQIPTTRRLRRRIRFTAQGQRKALNRMYKGWLAIDRLREFGVPHFVDGPGQTPRTSGAKFQPGREDRSPNGR